MMNTAVCIIKQRMGLKWYFRNMSTVTIFSLNIRANLNHCLLSNIGASQLKFPSLGLMRDPSLSFLHDSVKFIVDGELQGPKDNTLG